MKKFSSLAKLTAVLGLGFILFCSFSNPNAISDSKFEGANTPTEYSGNIETSSELLLEIIKLMDQSCPMSMGEFGEIVSVKYIDGRVSFKSVVNKKYSFIIDAFNNNKQSMVHSVKQSFSYMNDPTVKSLFQIMKAEGCGLEVIYVEKGTQKTAKVILSTNDLADILNADKEYSPQGFLKEQSKVSNAQCPIKLEGGVTGTQVTYSNNEFVYYYKVDETVNSVEILQKNILNIRKNIINALKTEPSSQLLIQALKDAGATLVYKYTGDKTGKSCTIKINSSEL
jgi:hypothetical protein